MGYRSLALQAQQDRLVQAARRGVRELQAQLEPPELPEPQVELVRLEEQEQPEVLVPQVPLAQVVPAALPVLLVPPAPISTPRGMVAMLISKIHGH